MTSLIIWFPLLKYQTTVSTFISLVRASTGCNVGLFQWSIFRIFEIIIIYCFVVAICDLVHDVITIFHISYVLTASGNLF